MSGCQQTSADLFSTNVSFNMPPAARSHRFVRFFEVILLRLMHCTIRLTSPFAPIHVTALLLL
jgi:hypothetical protein